MKNFHLICVDVHIKGNFFSSFQFITPYMSEWQGIKPKQALLCVCIICWTKQILHWKIWFANFTFWYFFFKQVKYEYREAFILKIKMNICETLWCDVKLMVWLHHMSNFIVHTLHRQQKKINTLNGLIFYLCKYHDICYKIWRVYVFAAGMYLVFKFDFQLEFLRFL